jgi:hypothetical protein
VPCIKAYKLLLVQIIEARAISAYKLLTHKKLSENLDRISLVLLVMLGIAFVLFTFYPPQLPVFRDPITGKYGIPK